jgi:DNA modification methylase
LTKARGAAPWRNTILVGDARQRLAELPAASVDTVITSPPYYGQRDYGVPGQLGLEANVDDWVAGLRDVMGCIARVLKPSGVVWLNLGDGYARHPREGAPTKSLLLGPERLALALMADGWLLRNKVIWAKSNPMPSSVRDRLSPTHEVIYCLVRSPSYFFDLDAVRLPHRSHDQPRQSSAAGRIYPSPAVVAQIGPVRRTNLNSGLGGLKATGRVGHPWGRNPGDVWTVATAGYRQAHFATFPAALIERPLLASCPERVCSRCGTPWRRSGSPATTPTARDRVLRPGCDCQGDPQPGIVLDPFMGAGTVAVTAELHNRDWVGVELSRAYTAMAEARIRQARDARTGTSSTERRAA